MIAEKKSGERRVLARERAEELTDEEMASVTGAQSTVCTDIQGGRDHADGAGVAA